jgi:serine/threonine-protein phosphatase 2A activator
MSFQIPAKAILTPVQLYYFQTSTTHTDILAYIGVLNDSVVGVKLSAECPQSAVRSPRGLLSILLTTHRV